MNAFAIILLVLLGVFILFEGFIMIRDIVNKVKDKKNPKTQEVQSDTDNQVIE